MNKIVRKHYVSILVTIAAIVVSVITETTDNKFFKILSIVLNGLIALAFLIWDLLKQEYVELKIDVKNHIDKYYKDTPFFWTVSIAGFYLETRFTFFRFKNERNIIKCLSELNMFYKTEYEIQNFIRNNVPDLYILDVNKDVFAVIRFTLLNSTNINEREDGTPFLYDINGVFLGVVNYDCRVANKEGKYIGRIFDIGGFVFVEPINTKITTKINMMPNIIFTPTEKETIKNIVSLDNKKYLAELISEYNYTFINSI